jgi:multiple sugar transport system permease protein
MTRSRTSRIAKRGVAYATIAVALVVTLFPVYWIAANSFKLDIDIFAVPPEWFPFNPTLKHYDAAFVQRPFLLYALNSFIIAVASTLVSLVSAPWRATRSRASGIRDSGATRSPSGSSRRA